MYYPWNDGNDYNRLCYAFQKQLLFNDGKLIIHIGKGGGLGHKLVSLLRSITYAYTVEVYLDQISQFYIFENDLYLNVFY